MYNNLGYLQSNRGKLLPFILGIGIGCIVSTKNGREFISYSVSEVKKELFNSSYQKREEVINYEDDNSRDRTINNDVV
jgi:hypothetical protein